jgi:hypothetical protein
MVCKASDSISPGKIPNFFGLISNEPSLFFEIPEAKIGLVLISSSSVISGSKIILRQFLESKFEVVIFLDINPT